MNADTEWLEMKSLYQSAATPPAEELLRQVRDRRRRAWWMVAVEIVIVVTAVALCAALVLDADGWFGALVGLCGIAFALWVGGWTWLIRRRMLEAQGDSVVDQLAELRRLTEGSLKLSRATWPVCVAALLFIVMNYLGGLWQLPGAGTPSVLYSAVGVAYIAGFALFVRHWSRRKSAELERIEEIERSLLTEDG